MSLRSQRFVQPRIVISQTRRQQHVWMKHTALGEDFVPMLELETPLRCVSDMGSMLFIMRAMYVSF